MGVNINFISDDSLSQVNNTTLPELYISAMYIIDFIKVKVLIMLRIHNPILYTIIYN